MAFGPYVHYGTIIKDYGNANMVYEPSEIVGTKRTRIKSMAKGGEWSICTSHVERLNGTQRLFMKRLNRLTWSARASSHNFYQSITRLLRYEHSGWDD